MLDDGDDKVELLEDEDDDRRNLGDLKNAI